MSEVKIKFGNIEVELKDHFTAVEILIIRAKMLLSEVAKGE